ncbi:MAG: sulfur carrier protein ThiS [Nitrospinales bacterium]
MRLIINGQERENLVSKTLAELARELDIGAPHFAMALNGDVVPKSQYDTARIKDGDKIEIVHAVGGGV